MADQPAMTDSSSTAKGDQSWTMGRMAFQLDDGREAYILAHSSSYGEVGAALVRDTLALGDPAVMMLGKEQYAILRFLARAIHAARALDLGTFTGLSALALAEAMPAGHVVTLDRSREWSHIAEKHWSAAGVRERIDARHGEADAVLRELAVAGERFDVVFIDIDKAGLPRYLEAVLPLLNRDGMLIVDNTLWHGWVLDADRTDADTEGVRTFNRVVAADPRFDVALLPVADGMTLVRRSDYPSRR